MNVKRLIASPFLRKAGVLIGGTATAQLIFVAISPILTRLYSAADLGVLTIYTSVLGILGLVAALRYEQAILLAPTERAAHRVAQLCVGVSMVVSLLVLAGVLLVFDRVQSYSWAPILWFLPPGVLVLGLYQTFSTWAVRTEQFKAIAQTKISQGISGALIQVLGGLWGGQVAMLLGGHLAGQGTGLLSLWTAYHKTTRNHGFDLQEVQAAAVEYRRFPLIATFASVLNNAALLLPPIMLGIYFGPQVAGWFGLGQRVIGLPMSVIGGAVAQVYSSEMSRLLADGSREVFALAVRTVKRLLPLALLILLIGGLSPLVFGWVFGQSWYNAGLYVLVMTPAFVGQLLTSPISSTANLLNRQDAQLWGDAIRTFCIVLTIYLCFKFEIEAFYCICLLSAVMTVTYAGFIAMYLGLARKHQTAKEAKL